jgi:hypothetical protein
MQFSFILGATGLGTGCGCAVRAGRVHRALAVVAASESAAASALAVR